MQPLDLDSFWGRLKAQIHALFKDHGILRVLLTYNFHPIKPNAFRSGQLTTWELRRRIKQHGIKTVVNLRGKQSNDEPALLLEQMVCRDMGAAYRTAQVYSRRYPSADEIKQMFQLFDDIEYPALFHCKSGADRAGVAGTLYVYYCGGIAIKDAHQLAFRPYFHYKYASTGKLDAFFDAYIEFNEKQPISLLEWMSHHYDPKTVPFHYKNGLISFWVDKILKRE